MTERVISFETLLSEDDQFFVLHALRSQDFESFVRLIVDRSKKFSIKERKNNVANILEYCVEYYSKLFGNPYENIEFKFAYRKILVAINTINKQEIESAQKKFKWYQRKKPSDGTSSQIDKLNNIANLSTHVFCDLTSLVVDNIDDESALQVTNMVMDKHSAAKKLNDIETKRLSTISDAFARGFVSYDDILEDISNGLRVLARFDKPKTLYNREDLGSEYFDYPIISQNILNMLNRLCNCNLKLTPYTYSAYTGSESAYICLEVINRVMLSDIQTVDLETVFKLTVMCLGIFGYRIQNFMLYFSAAWLYCRGKLKPSIAGYNFNKSVICIY